MAVYSKCISATPLPVAVIKATKPQSHNYHKNNKEQQLNGTERDRRIGRDTGEVNVNFSPDTVASLEGWILVNKFICSFANI